jgi:aryl-alcohol dehydrogenase-like predicted oxidoreductase
VQYRQLAGKQVSAIGLGCMNVSHAYGEPLAEPDAARVLEHALDRGVSHLDTAALYGFGRNEALLGKVLSARRDEFFLASKCGMTGVDGQRVIDGRPETLLRTLDEALARLRTERIDLYYLHRCDPQVPIEESVGAMSRMIEAGKVGALGLSEVSAATLRRAHAIHPIAAVQSEYSLWTRNAEIAVLDACQALGAAFVAFSPLARGVLADLSLDPAAFAGKDIRRGLPRFQAPAFEVNRRLAGEFALLAKNVECTMAQLALAWLLSRGEHVLPIPGTTSVAHLDENMAAAELEIDAGVLDRAGEIISRQAVAGQRYPEAQLKEIDTEQFPDEINKAKGET